MAGGTVYNQKNINLCSLKDLQCKRICSVYRAPPETWGNAFIRLLKPSKNLEH